MRQALALPLFVVAFLGLAGCDKAGPVAPEGSMLTISASPNRIASDGVSTITVTARKSSGFPVNPGTPVFLSTTRGSIPTNGNTNDDGVVRVALSGNGDSGMATVKANAGAAEEVEIEVQIGIFAASLTLQASPTTIQENGGQIDLLAVVRDDQGQPIPGVTVNFTTTLGTLDSGGGLVAANNAGEASDVVRVRGRDVNATTASTFEVGVEVPKGDGSLLTRTRTITIQRSTP